MHIAEHQREHEHNHFAIDSTLLATERGVRTLKISLVGLLLTALAQVIVVWMSGSAALLADTFHNFADALTSIPLWIAFNLSKRTPTRAYTYGYGKAEDVAGIIIVFVVAFSAVAAGYESVQKLIHGIEIQHLGLVAAAAVIGFVGNELVAQYRISTGKAIGSAALVADGEHSRIDGLTSLAVLLGAVGVWLGVPQADPAVGIAISIIILGIVVQVAREILRRLMDKVDESLIDQIEQIAGSIDGITSVHDIRARWIGHKLTVELSIGVSNSMTVAKGHMIAASVQEALIQSDAHLKDVTIHVDPETHIGKEKHGAFDEM